MRGLKFDGSRQAGRNADVLRARKTSVSTTACRHARRNNVRANLGGDAEKQSSDEFVNSRMKEASLRDKDIAPWSRDPILAII